VLPNIKNVTEDILLSGIWYSKFENIKTSKSLLLTGQWEGGPGYWGSYWNTFETIRCAGLVVNSNPYGPEQHGVNGNNFHNLSSFNAVSNGLNDWKDNKNAGLRVFGDVENLVMQNCDFSYNDYGVYNEGSSYVQLIGCYLESVKKSGYQGNVNLMYCEMTDDGASFKTSNINYDGKTQLFMSDSANTRVGSIFQSGSSMYPNSDWKYLDKNGLPLNLINISNLPLTMVTEINSGNPYSKALRINNITADQAIIYLPFTSLIEGYASVNIIAKGDLTSGNESYVAFIHNFSSTLDNESNTHYGFINGEFSKTEYKIFNGKLGGRNTQTFQSGTETKFDLRKGMTCAIMVVVPAGKEIFISRVCVAPGQVATFTSSPELKQTGYDDSFPIGGTWSKGDHFYNTNPTPGGYIGWICTASGTPGTWKGFGLIEV
jgi:hypothetical protein